ncbi:MAG TPA: 50S ribosomal protein L6, partial [Candidatus Nanoarchaeia archaeon]|nr:50S ribosomal protein L6 [Candidatus Nanoarchaeia archaeon]
MSTDSTAVIEVPQGVEVIVGKDHVHIKGPKGDLKRTFPQKSIEIKVDAGKVTVAPRDKSSSTRALVGTFNSHIKNMITGAQTPFVYKLKIAYTHFPVTVSVSGSDFSVANFLGEKKPRKASLPKGVKVSIQGDKITIESPDIESAGKAATLIEQTTRISKRDRRVFQDGIFIVEKG